MDLINTKILNKINNLVKLSEEFDSEYKVIYGLNPETELDEKNIDILHSMTKNYIEIRKEHGEFLIIMSNLINSKASQNILETNKKNDKSKSSMETDSINILYDISSFNTIANNINDLINNIDYEYKKIAVKYPKFINTNPITIIFITNESDVEIKQYEKLINELKTEYPEYKYKNIKCANKSGINKCEKELEEYNIKIKSIKSLPLAFIVNNSYVTEIPLGKIDEINKKDTIRNLIN